MSHLAPRNHRNLWRNRSKIDLGRGSRAPKIESKLTPEPSEDTPWHPRAFQERLRSVLGRPRRAPGASRASAKTSRGARKSAQKHSGARRGNQNRRQVAPGSEKIMLSSPVSCAKLHRRDFSSILPCFWIFCKACEPLKVLRLPAKTKVRPFVPRVESLARCNLEKQRKLVPESMQKLRNHRNFRNFRHLRNLRELRNFRNLRKSRNIRKNRAWTIRDDPPGWPEPAFSVPLSYFRLRHTELYTRGTNP